MLFEGFDQIQNRQTYTNNHQQVAINFQNGQTMEGMEDKETVVKGNQKDNEQDTVFKTQEIIIEEMAIDGICGVY